MPRYKKKPFPLIENPEDLEPDELVFQIDFTKEIFRSYEEYLKRINLYRKRVWSCKATGRGNLTYEEALASEDRVSKRIQNIPKEYIAPILREVQFSMLTSRDLVNSIAAKLQGPPLEGAELYIRRDDHLCLCKVVQVIGDSEKVQLKIAWLDNNQNISGRALVDGDDLPGMSLPFSKRVLMSFVKDSTCRNHPWVLQENLAKKHQISTVPPEHLKSKLSLQNGLLGCNKKRKRSENAPTPVEIGAKEIKVYVRRNKLLADPTLCIKAFDGVISNGVNQNREATQSIKYPIEDLLVQPSEEDLLLMERPSPCRDFDVPMACVGDLLMVWDFCVSFGRLLQLSPFSLDDFQSSLCFKNRTPLIIEESCSALLHLLLKDNGIFSMAIENKNLNQKITETSWTEHLCCFLETCCDLGFSVHTSTIKRGQYGHLDIKVKLEIFRELVDRVLETSIFKNRLDDNTEERQALSAARRDEALDEGRKRREEKERKKAEFSSNEVKNHSALPNGFISEKDNQEYQLQENHASRNGVIDKPNSTKKKKSKKRKFKNKSPSTKRAIHKMMKNEIKESIEMKSAEERKKFIEHEIEKRPIRTNPLGKDRNYCRYWFFRRDGRIFVESADFSQWGCYQTKEEVDALIGSLNVKGVREKALKKQLLKFYNRICLEIEERSKEEETEMIEMEEALVRWSTRVRAPPSETPSLSFLKYVNKWKDM